MMAPIVNYRVPLVHALALLAGALLAQVVPWARWRWLGLTAVLASLGADILVPVSWPLRFSALALLLGPIIAYAGSQLRDIS